MKVCDPWWQWKHEYQEIFLMACGLTGGVIAILLFLVGRWAYLTWR